jgi:predicted RNase H-like HicB family nuclease
MALLKRSARRPTESPRWRTLNDNPCSEANGIGKHPTDCSFWLEDDGWNGVCEELLITVRGSSFEDAKRKMEAALQAHIESVLSQHSRASRKKVA